MCTFDEREGGRDVFKGGEDGRGIDLLVIVHGDHERDRRLRKVVLQLVVGVVNEHLFGAVARGN